MTLVRAASFIAFLVIPFTAPAAGARPLAAPQDSARADTARGGPTMDPITVTATRSPAPRTKIGTALSVVTAEALRREPPFTLAEGVSRAAGVFIDQAAGPGGPAIVRLRGGEEVFSLILMDGVQVNQNGGFFDFQGLSLTNFERIEVLRGPQSALYGGTAVNGVVHFITRPGAAGPARFRAELMGGDAAAYGGAAQGTVAVGGGSDRLRYSGGVGVAYDRGVFAVPHDVATREVSLRVDATPRRGLEVGAIARYMSVDGNLPVRDPGATRVPLDPNATNSRDRWVGLVRTTLQRGALAHRFGAALYRESFVFEDSRDGVSDPRFFVFDADFRLDERLLRTTIDYQGTWEGLAGATPVVAVVGGQYEREHLRDRTAGDFGTDTLELARGSAAAFAEAQVTVGARLHALAGVRVERVSDLEPEATPRVNAVLDLGEGVSLRGAVGRAWKAPNLQQQYLDNPFIMSNPDLRPERSWAAELGVRVRDRAGFRLDVSWFRQEYDDLIRHVQSAADPSRQVNRNIGRARARGWEIEGLLAAGETEFELNATFVRTAVLDNTGLNPREYPEGRPLPFRPAVTLGGAVYTPLASRLELAVRTIIVGQQVVLTERFSGRRAALAPYTLLGATLTLRLARDMDTFLKLDNLLGHRYETGFDRGGVPRTATMGIRWGS